jgi:hypothetical protein
MNSSQEIDNLITKNDDWRGATLAKLRKIILSVDPGITEDWKYMGSPVWSLDGPICIGNIFKNKVQLVFGNGASLDDPDKLFNSELGDKKWQYIDLYERDQIKEDSLKTLIRAAISYNQTK